MMIKYVLELFFLYKFINWSLQLHCDQFTSVVYVEKVNQHINIYTIDADEKLKLTLKF